jgi:hypothetical protein
MIGQLLLKELEMPPAQSSATLIAIVLLMGSCLAAGVWAADASVAGSAAAAEREARTEGAQARAGADATRGSNWQQAMAAPLVRARALLKAGYVRAPALVIALCAFIVLPIVALVSFFVQWVVRRRARRAAMRAAQRIVGDAKPGAEVPESRDLPLWPQEAWLTVEGPGQGTLPLERPLVRIGRHQDNDIRLPDATVHRYHAVIERTPEEAFVIVDVSGKNGNGVRINGERQERARLFDGDVIEVGRTRLKFESASV